MAFKPSGYNSVSPYLMVSDGKRFIDMMSYIFGAKETRKYYHENGKIMHAEIQLDDSIIMFSEATENYPVYSLWLHVYVPDVFSSFRKAIEYGCEPLQEPTQKEGDPDCRGSFKDADGNNWSVSTQQ
jgi:PhnB protein